MSKQVMEQALEALKVVYPSMLDGEDVCKQRSDAIAALKEAIKQAGEPVGYRWKWPDGILPDYHPRNGWQFESTYPEIHPSNIGVIVIEPLYTAAPSIPEGCRQDAERYSYLRSHAVYEYRNGPGLYWYLPRGRYLGINSAEALDDSIDAALSSALASEGENE